MRFSGNKYSFLPSLTPVCGKRPQPLHEGSQGHCKEPVVNPVLLGGLLCALSALLSRLGRRVLPPRLHPPHHRSPVSHSRPYRGGSRHVVAPLAHYHLLRHSAVVGENQFLYLRMWSLDLYVYHNNKINYEFIFEKYAPDLLHFQQQLLMASRTFTLFSSIRIHLFCSPHRVSLVLRFLCHRWLRTLLPPSPFFRLHFTGSSHPSFCSTFACLHVPFLDKYASSSQ